MSLWRREAIARFPELHRQIADAEGPLFVWMAIRNMLFNPAYAKEPPDRETIARVYDYAAWCLKHSSHAVRLCVGDNFYELLPDNPRIWQDTPRYVSQEEFDKLHFAWDYYMTPQGFADLRREFTQNKARIETEQERRAVPFAGSRPKR